MTSTRHSEIGCLGEGYYQRLWPGGIRLPPDSGGESILPSKFIINLLAVLFEERTDFAPDRKVQSTTEAWAIQRQSACIILSAKVSILPMAVSDAINSRNAGPNSKFWK